jgi:predicted nucleic acid-binding protein
MEYIYCDSSVFLAYLNAEIGRIENVEPLFEHIRQDQNQLIITSVLSIVEVSRASREKMMKISRNPQQVNAILQEIDTLWQEKSLLKLIDISESVAYQAREFTRKGEALGYRLKNIDALHLASAKIIEAKEFLTYDGDFTKMAEITGLTIKFP